jgi:hypothetical protein
MKFHRGAGNRKIGSRQCPPAGCDGAAQREGYGHEPVRPLISARSLMVTQSGGATLNGPRPPALMNGDRGGAHVVQMHKLHRGVRSARQRQNRRHSKQRNHEVRHTRAVDDAGPRPAHNDLRMSGGELAEQTVPLPPCRRHSGSLREIAAADLPTWVPDCLARHHKPWRSRRRRRASSRTSAAAASRFFRPSDIDLMHAVFVAHRVHDKRQVQNCVGLETGRHAPADFGTGDVAGFEPCGQFNFWRQDIQAQNVGRRPGRSYGSSRATCQSSRNCL